MDVKEISNIPIHVRKEKPGQVDGIISAISRMLTSDTQQV